MAKINVDKKDMSSSATLVHLLVELNMAHPGADRRISEARVKCLPL